MVHWKKFNLVALLAAVVFTLIPFHLNFLSKNPFLYGLAIYWSVGSIYAAFVVMRGFVKALKEERSSYGSMEKVLSRVVMGVVLAATFGPMAMFLLRDDRKLGLGEENNQSHAV